MARRKQKNAEKIEKLLFEIYGILIVSFGILIFLSIYSNSTGILGKFIGMGMKGLCGFGAYIIPFFILMYGMGLIIKQNLLNLKLRFYALWFCFVFLLMLIEIHMAASIEDLGFISRISKAYTNGGNGIGGGALGEILTYPIVKLFGVTGAYLFAGTFMFINVLIVTNASIYKIALSIKDMISSGFKRICSIIADMKVKNDENKMKANRVNNPIKISDIQPAEDKRQYIDEINKKIKILDFFKTSETSLSAADSDSKLDEEKIIIPQVIEAEKIESEHVEVPKLNKGKGKKHQKAEENINISVNYNNQNYNLPPLSLLNSGGVVKGGGDKKELINNAKVLEETLESFGVEARVIQVSRGPVITRYELQPNPGVKVSKIVNLSDDIALNLAAPAVRIEAPIPGKAAVGIEIPNKDISMVYLREVIESADFTEHKSSLAFALGKDVAGNCVVADLAKMPHLLIAGATGSGKSVCVNTLITSILYKASPEKVRLLMIDPKVVELSTYNGIPHLLIPVVTDPRKAAGALGWAVQEMTNRYKLFADNNVRNIESYNDLVGLTNPEAVLPQVVIIIDELADLMMAAPNDVEDAICRLAQMARAAGMHLVVATQRPSVDVITGVIKANIPSRISFAVSSQIDSRTILDMAGAEKLLGKGDMLYYPIGESKPIRVQGAFVSEREVEQVVEFIKAQTDSKYKEDIIDEIDNAGNNSEEVDEMLSEAIKIVVETGQASVSLLQRRLRIGYNRAARLIDSMEERGIIGGYGGSKPRQVLISKEEYENLFE